MAACAESDSKSNTALSKSCRSYEGSGVGATGYKYIHDSEVRAVDEVSAPRLATPHGGAWRDGCVDHAADLCSLRTKLERTKITHSFKRLEIDIHDQRNCCRPRQGAGSRSCTRRHSGESWVPRTIPAVAALQPHPSQRAATRPGGRPWVDVARKWWMGILRRG